MFKPDKARLERYKEIDRGLGRHAEKLSRFLWPWQERWLFLVVGLLAVFDFTSTYILLEVSRQTDVYESGLVAIWALGRGGYPLLLLVDIIAALGLSAAALIARRLYRRRGLADYGRAAFVFLLAPYVIIATIAIINNIVLVFR